MRLSLLSAAALIGVSLLALPVPASAAALGGLSMNHSLQTAISEQSPIVKVQRRRGRGGPRGGRGRGGNAGTAAAVGAAIGIFGGIIATEAARSHEQRVEGCWRRHRRGYFHRQGRRIYCDDL